MPLKHVTFLPYLFLLAFPHSQVPSSPFYPHIIVGRKKEKTDPKLITSFDMYLSNSITFLPFLFILAFPLSQVPSNSSYPLIIVGWKKDKLTQKPITSFDLEKCDCVTLKLVPYTSDFPFSFLLFFTLREPQYPPMLYNRRNKEERTKSKLILFLKD